MLVILFTLMAGCLKFLGVRSLLLRCVSCLIFVEFGIYAVPTPDEDDS